MKTIQTNKPMNKIMTILFTLLVVACTPPPPDMEALKEEIRQAEKDFNDLAAAEGLAVAFGTFAAEDGVIRRRRQIISGSDAIREFYENNSDPSEQLSWEPEFIDVSRSGDMAYTYGPYEFSYPDSTGEMQTSTGIFHTVWKRQPDGSWKFVWD